MISIIAAMGKNRGLGLGGKLPWHLSDDLKRFKALTKGHTVIMGRKTHEAIGRPLPERRNIVITHNPAYTAAGCEMTGSFEGALRMTNGELETFVIGGGMIYSLALPYATKLYLTFVDDEPEADTFFPEFDEHEWNIVNEEKHSVDEKHNYSFTFKVYERKTR